MNAKPFPISDPARLVLRRMDYDTELNALRFAPQDDALDRPLYEECNEVLARIGGKWMRTKKAHAFEIGISPDALLGAILKSGTAPAKNPLAFFPTPPAVAAEVMKYLEAAPCFFRDRPARFLEPSAGRGALAVALREENPEAEIVCVEQDPLNCAHLRAQEFWVTEGDFLEYLRHENTEPHDSEMFDRIAMNPPFAVPGQRTSYALHVVHAWGMLKPGGRLVAVVPAGFDDREGTALPMKCLQPLRDLTRAHGHVEKLPDGAFKDSGTSASTRILVLHKPEEPADGEDPFAEDVPQSEGIPALAETPEPVAVTPPTAPPAHTPAQGLDNEGLEGKRVCETAPRSHIAEGGDKRERTLTCCLPSGCGAEVRWRKGESSPLIAFHRDHRRCATPEGLAERNARAVQAQAEAKDIRRQMQERPKFFVPLDVVERFSNANSCDTLSLVGERCRVKKVITHDGQPYACVVNSVGSDGFRSATAYRLMSEAEFDGVKVTRENCENWRDRVAGSYHGVVTSHEGQTYVLVGPPVEFVAAAEVPAREEIFLPAAGVAFLDAPGVYAGQSIMERQKVAKPFIHAGLPYAVVGILGGAWEAHRMVPAGDFAGETHDYDERPGYHGLRVTHKGLPYILSDPRILFKAAPSVPEPTAPMAAEPPVREFVVWRPGDAAEFSHLVFRHEWRPGRVTALNLPHNVHVEDCESSAIYLCKPAELRRPPGRDVTHAAMTPEQEAFEAETEARIAAYMGRTGHSRNEVLDMIRAGQITLRSPHAGLPA